MLRHVTRPVSRAWPMTLANDELPSQIMLSPMIRSEQLHDSAQNLQIMYTVHTPQINLNSPIITSYSPSIYLYQ